MNYNNNIKIEEYLCFKDKLIPLNSLVKLEYKPLFFKQSCVGRLNGIHNLLNENLIMIDVSEKYNGEIKYVDIKNITDLKPLDSICDISHKGHLNMVKILRVNNELIKADDIVKVNFMLTFHGYDREKQCTFLKDFPQESMGRIKNISSFKIELDTSEKYNNNYNSIDIDSITLIEKIDISFPRKVVLSHIEMDFMRIVCPNCGVTLPKGKGEIPNCPYCKQKIVW
jgi:hypothetical protein